MPSPDLWTPLTLLPVSHPSLLFSYVGVPVGVPEMLSTRVCLLPERGVTLAVRKFDTGVVTSSRSGLDAPASIGGGPCGFLAKGVTGDPFAATFGVNGVLLTARAAATPAGGGRPRSGIVGERVRLFVSDSQVGYSGAFVCWLERAHFGRNVSRYRAAAALWTRR